MASVEPIPRLGTPARELFEASYHQKDHLRLEGLKLDESIAQLQYIFGKYGEAEDFQSLCDQLYAETAQKAKIIAQKPIENWNDYFRLLSRMDSIDVAARAKVLFSEPKSSVERSKLADGYEGVIVDRLRLALDTYDTMEGIDSEELTGVINEHTALALFNRAQLASRIAIPASTVDDLRHSIDIDFLRMAQSGGSYTQPVQVKTSPFALKNEFKYAKILYIDAENMDNYRNDFTCSRLLVEECRGAASEDDKSILNAAARRLIASANAHQTYKK